MKPKDTNWIRAAMPDLWTLETYPDRASAWLLSRALTGDESVRDLKAGPMSKLLGRPLIKPLVTEGGGRLRKSDLDTLADISRSHRIAGLAAGGDGLAASVDYAVSENWQRYPISAAVWAAPFRSGQMSRSGQNLVLQLGFPKEHDFLMVRTVGRSCRALFEVPFHPVRRDGPPTLAWVRMDIDEATGSALIEEVQGDWLRRVRRHIAVHGECCGHLAWFDNLCDYSFAIHGAYGRVWADTALFSALVFLRDEMGIRDIWMHTPGSGRKLKGISGVAPPRSLYTDLPRRFAFERVEGLPAFLIPRHRNKPVNRAKVRKQPMWRLQL